MESPGKVLQDIAGCCILPDEVGCFVLGPWTHKGLHVIVHLVGETWSKLIYFWLALLDAWKDLQTTGLATQHVPYRVPMANNHLAKK